MISQLARGLSAAIRKNFFVLIGCITAPLCLSIPIQHYITLGRYQHYGMAIFLFGMGYVMHTIWTWKHSFPATRFSNCYAALFFVSIGLIFYSCPWLDPVMSVMTEEQTAFRHYLIRGYFMGALGLMLVWVIAAVEERMRLHKLKTGAKTVSQVTQID
ncbi:MAG: hypothetical protein P4L53_18510 [Candidatus Obscuribacterales bacterium]|nr:hypothetical protein [Candidatus Obscuribacterales bacterium]